jgi:DNA-binding HxlR family transcriptional regulator
MKLEKVTEEFGVTEKAPKRAEKRWYDDACGTALAMELVGERWSLLIVRELMFGPRRFGELRKALTGISANVLTQRLEGLEAAEILVRRKLPPPASVQVYALTPWGYESERAIQELGRWATRSPKHDTALPLSAASLMLSFRTMIDRSRSGAVDRMIGFQLGDEGFVARVDEDGIAIRRDDPVDVDVLFTSDPMTIASIVYGGRPIADAEAANALVLRGDRALAARFVTLFPLPPKTGSA